MPPSYDAGGCRPSLYYARLSKSIAFPDASARVPVYISNFPDRDTSDDDQLLTIQFTAADGQQTSLIMNVHEIDQDRDGIGPYSVTVDFSKDQTGFFFDPQKTNIIQQAAADWATSAEIRPYSRLG